MQDQGSSTVSFCPSFSTYSNDKLADIAAKVIEEEENKGITLWRNQSDVYASSSDDDDVENDEFEFVLVRGNPEACTTTDGLDEVSYPVFPLFNRDLLLDRDQDDVASSAIRLPLKKLFIADGDPPSSSSSSSEADESEGIVPGTYCVWTPEKPKPSPSPSRCKKSNSTGSSSKQKWRLLDFLHLRRSNSDGKESFIFLNPNHNNNNNDDDEVNKMNINIGKKKKEEKAEKGKISTVGAKEKGKVSAHEVFYVRKMALKEADKRRRSYLPYRQALVGFLSNVNGLGKTFPPFKS